MNSAQKLADRLEQTVQRSGWSARGVAVNAGLAPNAVSNAIRQLRSGAKTTMTVESIEAIAKVCFVRAGWLAFGEGSP